MVLKKLILQNFRNYSKKEFEFSSGINIIVGPNSIGKTNILEAVYLLASGKSVRAKGMESEAIKYGSEISNVKCQMLNGITLEILLTTGEMAGEKAGKKKYLVNGVPKRQIDFLGNLRAVYFGPEDLQLITDSPSLRRKYLDMVLFQIDREYARASLSYEKGVRSRNKILEGMREFGITDRRRLYFWDQLLIKNGNIITSGRGKFVDFLNSRPKFRNVGEFKIGYDRSAISEERLGQYQEEEVRAGVTLIGPHRDDFNIKIIDTENKERDLSIYGSRGEQRLAILWLKLGEMGYIKEKTESLPILLLDDIFSELDMEHRKLVFDVVKNQQTIITTSDLGMVGKEWLKDVLIIDLQTN